jgi:nitrite reductase/ring-hydroxylating ferredoxin subunit
MFVGINKLPSYALSTVEELLECQEQNKTSASSSNSKPEQWEACAPLSSSPTAVTSEGRYAFNGRGRLLLVTRDEREIAVVAVKRPSSDADTEEALPLSSSSMRLANNDTIDVFAFDKNCYHVGYPMDMGDIEDIDVTRKGGKGFHVMCITCPLHNRIFDLRTGGMVTVAYDESSIEHAPCLVRAGKRKGGAPSVLPCHQRVHPVTLVAEDDLHHRIVVHDTFGHGNATASSENTVADEFQAEVKLLSDKYNPVGAAEDFHEFNPKKGNSFVNFRPPEDPKRTSEDPAPVTAGSTDTIPPEAEHKNSRADAHHKQSCCVIS